MRRFAARGLRYSQWHTPALSALTRSCLLTGRDAAASRRAIAPGRAVMPYPDLVYDNQCVDQPYPPPTATT